MGTVDTVWVESSDAAKHPSMYIRVTYCKESSPANVSFILILWMNKLSLSNVK